MFKWIMHALVVVLITTQSNCASAPENESAFEPVECWFEIPDGVSVTCGYVGVPEDRSQPFIPDNTISLAVAVFHSTSQSPAPDPIVYHVGGPGGHMLNIIPQIYDKVIAPFLETRDLIFLDPRGTGFSQPALECDNGEAPGDCVRRLFAAGQNLHFYSSSSMAQDLQAVRATLNYDRWNLLGQSYGTHVAQVTLREAPEGLRSVILDSVMPVVIPARPDGKSSFDVSLQRLFQRCENDSACNDAYPNLPGAMEDAVQRLNLRPVSLRTSCYGKEQSVLLTGERLTSMLYEALYEAELIPALPYAITAAADGIDYSFWNNVVCWETVIDFLLTDGTHWAVQCSDGRLGNACEDWPIVVEQSPVVSDLPILILNGEFDPVTPLEYGHSVAEGFSQSYVFDFPGLGHWVNGTGDPCQRAIINSFLNNPMQQPDPICLTEMDEPHFVLKKEMP
jgi:pimeloyl-ACP methyl ester carboxylesterase